MSANTAIEWADHTFNPWIGCTKISPACNNCYAAVSTPARTMGIAWGSGEPRRFTSKTNWALPLRWNKQAEKFLASHGRRQRVFCASLADVFDNEAPFEWRVELFDLIAKTPNLDWLLLTKRIGNAAEMLNDVTISLTGHSKTTYRALPNVWLGATICNQTEADRDIPKLLSIPAAKRFLSIEPILGALDISKYVDYCENLDKSGIMRTAGGEHIKYDAHCGISWVIVGGESGNAARPMHPVWARSVQAQCSDARVPFFFKQWGEWGTACVSMTTGFPVFREFTSYQQWVNKASGWINGGICLDKEGKQLFNGADFANARDEDKFPVTIMHRVGKKAAGRLLDGAEWNEYPE
jgi:protein gp37